MGRRAGEEALRVSSALATSGTEPDRAILLDMPADTADVRVGDSRDRLESRGEAYRLRVAERFRTLFAEDPEQRRIVSGEGSQDAVETRVWEAVRDLFD